jgi:hypothetical protein
MQGKTARSVLFPELIERKMQMPKFNSPLNHVHVAAPCSANWDEMNGDERKRFCGLCQLNVYNLSAMTKMEAEKLLVESEGRLCVRFYRRTDGTIITQNCPKGIAAIKRRVSRLLTAALSTVLTFLSGIGISATFSQKRSEVLGKMPISVDIIKQQDKNNLNFQQFEHTTGALVAPIQGETLPVIKPQKNIH